MSNRNTSSRSCSNSPYGSGRNQLTHSGQQHRNGTIHSSSCRSSANNTELSQETNTTLSSQNLVTHLMDIDNEYHSNNATNGFINHETVLFSSMTIRISNGHSLLDDDNNNNLIILDQNTNNNGCLILESAEMCDGMECDDNNHTMNIETNSYDVQKRDDQILIRILQFDRERHVLKQQSHIEYAKKKCTT